eukprot:754989-Hanusia_phi.AAC.1
MADQVQSEERGDERAASNFNDEALGMYISAFSTPTFPFPHNSIIYHGMGQDPRLPIIAKSPHNLMGAPSLPPSLPLSLPPCFSRISGASRASAVFAVSLPPAFFPPSLPTERVHEAQPACHCPLPPPSITTTPQSSTLHRRALPHNNFGAPLFLETQKGDLRGNEITPEAHPGKHYHEISRVTTPTPPSRRRYNNRTSATNIWNLLSEVRLQSQHGAPITAAVAQVRSDAAPGSGSERAGLSLA